MSSINTNVSSMLARRVLGQQQSMMTQTLERLSTGVSINRGSDNPAGLRSQAVVLQPRPVLVRTQCLLYVSG